MASSTATAPRRLRRRPSRRSSSRTRSRFRPTCCARAPRSARCRWANCSPRRSRASTPARRCRRSSTRARRRRCSRERRSRENRTLLGLVRGLRREPPTRENSLAFEHGPQPAAPPQPPLHRPNRERANHHEDRRQRDELAAAERALQPRLRPQQPERGVGRRSRRRRKSAPACADRSGRGARRRSWRGRARRRRRRRAASGRAAAAGAPASSQRAARGTSRRRRATSRGSTACPGRSPARRPAATR